MASNWDKWDADHRSAGVRVASAGPGRSKVTSGGKHLGNIEQRDGKHVVVMQAKPGQLSSREFGSHQEALDHIRKSHGLKAESAVKTPSAPKAQTAVDTRAAQASYIKAAQRAVASSRVAQTATQHRSAAAAHEKAAAAAVDAKTRALHQAAAAQHTKQAKAVGSRTADRLVPKNR